MNTTMSELVTLGGKPNPGTKSDKRLKENPPKKKDGKPFTRDELAQIQAFIDQLTAAPADAQPEPDESRGKPFTTLMAVEGLETSDSRMFELDSVTWRLPMPFMVRDTATHGPGETAAPTWAAGQIVEAFRDPEDPTRIMGRGYLMDNAAGARAEEIILQAFRGVSVDAYDDGVLGPAVQPTHVDQDGNPVAVLLRYSDPVITRLTLVPTPAFEACCIWLDGEEMPSIAAGVGGGKIPEDAKPEVVKVPANAYELLVASGGGQVNPPKAAFFQPEPDHRQEMITDPLTGFVSGHLFGYGECHTAYADRCEMSPMSRTTPPFVGFHRTEAHCDDGSKVACGWIPVNTNHSKISHGRREAESWTQEQTWDHYENSGTLIAKVRASNGRHGVWLSGTLLPGLPDRELAISQGLSVSGHWNVFTDPRTNQRYPDELLAILGGVPQPGYPETRVRAELLVASGQVIGHIDPFGCEEPCDDCDEEAPMSAADVERIARLEAVVSLLLGTADDEIRAIAGLDEEGLAALVDLAAAAPEAPAEGETIEVTLEVDLAAPLTPAELAQWYGKYDPAARAAMAADGRARPDGSCAIGDAEDLVFAARSAGIFVARDAVSPALVAHIDRAADRLGLADTLVPAK